MNKRIGPLLSDKEFFENCLDLELPGMEDVKEAVKAGTNEGTYQAARKVFAEHIRESLQPERFFSMPYEKPENAYKRMEETDFEAAERIVNNCLISVGVPYQFGNVVDWEFNPTYNQYREWTWQLSRHNEWKELAYVYRTVNKDEKYAKACAEFFSSWVKQALYPGDVAGDQTKCWRTIECGIRMGATWPYALHTFYNSPYFTDNILVDWYKSLWEHGNRMQYHHWRNNWLIMEMNGLAYIAILCPEFKKSKEWLAFAFDRLGKELKRQFYADGFQFELSTNYHDVVINNYQRTIQLAKAYEIPVPDEFMNDLENAVRLYVRIMMPNGKVPDLNDGRMKDASEFIQPKQRLYPNRSDFEWVISHGKKGNPPEYTSIALPYSGFMVMRNGWEENSLWGLMDAAPFGTGHQHEDKLSLLLYMGGKMVLTEGGNYAYDDSEMRRYVLSTRSHNTIRVDGMDQNRRRDYIWKEEDIQKDSGMEYEITSDYDFAKATYKEGYGSDVDCSITHTRSVYFIKNPEKLVVVKEGEKKEESLEPFFLVVDRMKADCPHTYETLWHLDTRELQIRQGRIEAKELTILSSVSKADSTILCGQEKPEWQGFRSFGGNQGDYLPVPTVQQKVIGQDIRMVTAFYPGERRRMVFVEACEDLNDTKIHLHLANGTILEWDEELVGKKDK